MSVLGCDFLSLPWAGGTSPRPLNIGFWSTCELMLPVCSPTQGPHAVWASSLLKRWTVPTPAKWLEETGVPSTPRQPS